MRDESRIDRRTFLGTLASAAAISLAERSATASPAVLRPCPPTAWRKTGRVLAGPAGSFLQNFTCAAEPLETGAWRLWYSQSGSAKGYNVGVADGVPGETLRQVVAVLTEGEPADAPLAVGNLPADWRPVQPVHIRLGDGRHRLYFWAHGPRVVRYLAAESDDGRRYRVLDPLRPCLYHPHDRAVDGAEAAKLGLQRYAARRAELAAGEAAAPAGLISNDATNVYRLADGSFEMYSVGLVEVGKEDPAYIAADNAAGLVRVIDRYTSDDGLRWSDRRRVLVPDAADPADLQFYYLAVTHTPQGRVGMLGRYSCAAQTADIEWCFSADGIEWQRTARGAWIERGKSGEADCYGIYAPHSLVEQDGRWHLFYTGTNAAHNGKHSYGPAEQSVLAASTETIWAPVEAIASPG